MSAISARTRLQFATSPSPPPPVPPSPRKIRGRPTAATATSANARRTRRHKAPRRGKEHRHPLSEYSLPFPRSEKSHHDDDQQGYESDHQDDDAASSSAAATLITDATTSSKQRRRRNATFGHKPHGHHEPRKQNHGDDYPLTRLIDRSDDDDKYDDDEDEGDCTFVQSRESTVSPLGVDSRSAIIAHLFSHRKRQRDEQQQQQQHKSKWQAQWSRDVRRKVDSAGALQHSSPPRISSQDPSKARQQQRDRERRQYKRKAHRVSLADQLNGRPLWQPASVTALPPSHSQTYGASFGQVFGNALGGTGTLFSPSDVELHGAHTVRGTPDLAVYLDREYGLPGRTPTREAIELHNALHSHIAREESAHNLDHSQGGVSDRIRQWEARTRRHTIDAATASTSTKASTTTYSSGEDLQRVPRRRQETGTTTGDMGRASDHLASFLDVYTPGPMYQKTPMPPIQDTATKRSRTPLYWLGGLIRTASPPANARGRDRLGLHHPNVNIAVSSNSSSPLQLIQDCNTYLRQVSTDDANSEGSPLALTPGRPMNKLELAGYDYQDASDSDSENAALISSSTSPVLHIKAAKRLSTSFAHANIGEPSRRATVEDCTAFEEPHSEAASDHSTLPLAECDEGECLLRQPPEDISSPKGSEVDSVLLDPPQEIVADSISRCQDWMARSPPAAETFMGSFQPGWITPEPLTEVINQMSTSHQSDEPLLSQSISCTSVRTESGHSSGCEDEAPSPSLGRMMRSGACSPPMLLPDVPSCVTHSRSTSSSSVGDSAARQIGDRSYDELWQAISRMVQSSPCKCKTAPDSDLATTASGANSDGDGTSSGVTRSIKSINVQQARPTAEPALEENKLPGSVLPTREAAVPTRETAVDTFATKPLELPKRSRMPFKATKLQLLASRRNVKPAADSMECDDGDATIVQHEEEPSYQEVVRHTRQETVTPLTMAGARALNTVVEGVVPQLTLSFDERDDCFRSLRKECNSVNDTTNLHAEEEQENLADDAMSWRKSSPRSLRRFQSSSDVSSLVRRSAQMNLRSMKSDVSMRSGYGGDVMMRDGGGGSSSNASVISRGRSRGVKRTAL
ncbi:unnamed protein product [Sympodiomycopsis kandeliae]